MIGLIEVAILGPGLAALGIGSAWLIGVRICERWVARLTSGVFLYSTVALLSVAVQLARDGKTALDIALGEWFRAGDYAFDLGLRLDRISLPLLILTSVLTGVIGAFSRTYMHRERGYLRFFFLLHLFGFGAMLAFAAADLDLLVGGWELVGLSSVLLISFFQERPDPVDSAVRVFAVYRSADIGLLTGVFWVHHFRHSASLVDLGEHQFAPAAATLIGLLLSIAAMGKAAQIPFSGWLPRAMEGPTPSSAIFYGVSRFILALT